VIRLSGISRTAGRKTILEKIDLEIKPGEIFTLIGPSGSGKTSLLRIIDFLDKPTTGTMFFDKKEISAYEKDRLAVRRRMAMVFQKPAVLNTTVAKNVAFGLKFRGVEIEQITTRVRDALALVGLSHMEGRRAVTLSGGEMQRVAIARAMVTHPEVLLLDEPTANLDPVNAEIIEDLVIRINKKFHTTIIFSTHDMIQGQRLADRIGVIMDGRMVQVGDLHDIFYRPIGIDIARFVGIDTVLHGVIRGNDKGLAAIDVGETLFEAPTTLTTGKVALYIRPEEITVSPDITEPPVRSSIRNHFVGTIKKMMPFGPFIRVTIDCGFPLTALITRRSCEELGLTPGTKVRASVKASAIHVLAEAP
jgi:tungstate transport system ATP-binding protein